MSKRSRSSQGHLPSPISPFFGATAGYFAVCLVLGGGTRAGFLSDVALQVLAVPLLLWAGWRLLDIPAEQGGRRGRVAIVVCLAAASLPLVQLVPLPPALWMALPGRGDFISTLDAAGLEVGWLPLSMSPYRTWLSALALLPPAAVLLSAIQLGYADRRRLTLVLLIIGLVGAMVGLLQVAQGPGSPLRFFALTNPTEAVGFFANRNHYAAQLYCLVPIAAAWTIAAVAEVVRADSFRSRRTTPHVVTAMLGFTALVILVAAQVMARSRAGLGLMLGALLGAFAMAYAGSSGMLAPRLGARRTKVAPAASRLLLVAIGLAFLFGAQFVLYRLQDRFGGDLRADGRLPMARNTFEAALAYMPFGSGMGSFVPVYQAFESPADGFAHAYVNRAHNDYLELWLEAGLAGLGAMLLLLGWVVQAFLSVWRRGLPGARLRDNLLACGAALVLVLLLAHSTVDYPLRTAALMAVFALAAAMVVAPVGAQAAAKPLPDALAAIEEGAASREAPSQKQASASFGQGPFVPAPPRNDWPSAWQTPRRLEKPNLPRLERPEASNDQREGKEK